MAERVQLSVEDYLAELLALVEPITDTDLVPLDAAAGTVLAEPITSPLPVPHFANSAMDGFAVRHDEVSVGQPLTEVGDVPAGSAADPALGAGECIRIMTGAPLPTAADTVVPRELVTDTDQGVVVHELPAKGSHVRLAGEDFEAGAELLAAGVVLNAHHLSLAASAGRGDLVVRRRPRLAVASTGDELRGPGEELARGQIYESNHIRMVSAARGHGAQIIARAVLPDDPVAFADGLERLCERADLVVLSGGVSVGDHDVVRDVLTDQAGGTFRHVQMQPGRPQGWAQWTHISGRVVPVIGLPGNPLSTAISQEVLVRPVLAKLLGIEPPAWGTAVAAVGWRSPAGRRQFIPVGVSHDDQGRRWVEPAHRRGSLSHMVSALASADAIAEVAAEVSEVNPGDLVRVRSL